MTVLDRIRVHRTALAFDYWMDVEGVPMRGRKARREELRANLAAAVEQAGYAQARRRLGSLRELARAAAGDATLRPRWLVGSYAALAVLAVLAWISLFAATAWIDGALAAGVTGRHVQGQPVLVPWVTAFVDGTHPDARPSSSTLGFTANLLALLIPALLTFVVASRSWRLLTKRAERTPVRL